MTNTFLGKFLDQMVIVFTPLKDALSDTDKFIGLLRELGWNVTGLPTSSSFSTAVDNVFTLYDSLSSGSSEEDVLAVIQAIKDVYTFLNGMTIAFPGIAPADEADFLDEFPKRLFELLIVKNLNVGNPSMYTAFETFSIIKPVFTAAAGNRPAYARKELDYSFFTDLITDPVGLFKDAIHWNTTDFVFSYFAKLFLNLLASNGLAATLRSSSPVDLGLFATAFPTISTGRAVSLNIATIQIGTEYEGIDVVITEAKGVDLAHSGVIISILIPTGISMTNNIVDDLDLTINATTYSGNILGVLLTPSGVAFNYLTQPGTPLPTIGFQLQLAYKPDTPSLLFGRPDGTRLELKNATLGLEARAVGEELEFIVDADLSGILLTIDPSDTDGFISKIFGDSKKEINVPLVIRWSSIKGITFMSAAAFEIKIPSNVSIGPINIRDLTVAIKAPSGANKVTTNIAANISGTLGPVSFLVENVGLAANIDTNGGNVGPFGVSLGFKPPTGIGVSVDAGMVTGGGYLKIDTDRGLYAGAVELSIKKTLSIVGIGIVTTKNPDGSKGYSMLMMVTCTFSPSIPIGFGFNLSGVGGLVGINRDMNPDAIREGVRNGGINKVMFPENVVENIDGIIQNLQAFFPQAHGRYVAGLLFRITWGPALPLITINLGLVVNFPEPIRIAVLGTVRVALPDPNAPLLELNVAFAGVIDFDRKYLAFDASLYNSRLLFLQLSGDMCVRLFWGEHKEMLFSAGGFHPSFNPPADLMLPANMKRLSMSVLDNDALKLTFSTYFAVTSNTVQFGANVKVDFNAVVRIRGEVGFDVLFHFNPFSFEADAYGSASLSISRFDLMAMNFVLKISGPEQWQVQGSINYSFLNGLVKGTGRIDKKWPSTAPLTIAPSYVALGADVYAALNDNKNWKATLPEVQQLNVKIKEIPDTDLVIMPMGLLTITQKVAPLGFKIQRYGTKMLSDDGMYNITSVTLGGGVPESNMMYEVDNFASAQFMNMSDADKLRAPSFEYYKCGVKVAVINDNPWSGLIPTITVRVIEYNKIIIDKKQRKKRSIREQMNNFMVNAFVAGGRIADSKVSQSITAIKKKPVANTAMLQEKFKFVTTDGLVMPPSTPLTIPLTLTYNSKAEALAAANVLGTVSSNNVLLVPSYMP